MMQPNVLRSKYVLSLSSAKCCCPVSVYLPAHLAVKAFEDTSENRQAILRAALSLCQRDGFTRYEVLVHFVSFFHVCNLICRIKLCLRLCLYVQFCVLVHTCAHQSIKLSWIIV